MRKKTVNLITAYMIFGAILNVSLILFLGAVNISLTEKFITIVFTNACIIWIARDLEQYREARCKNKRAGSGETSHY